jgi:1D-myo-inositol 3-kinase
MHRDAVVAGHYCHDLLLTSAGERRELGGSAAYASAVLRAAGIQFSVVAKVGEDFLYPQRVPPALVVPGGATTCFVDDYRGTVRLQTLRAAAPSIAPEDLRDACTVGLAVPVASEIPAATLSRMRELSRVLIADAQGFVRTWNAAGKVAHSPPPPELLAAMAQVDYLKVGGDEACVLDLTQLRRSSTILLTDGARGCTILSATAEQHVPAFPAREVDPTGAGDCFLAGFAVGLLRGWPRDRAARLGSWCGARGVESVGIPVLDRLPAVV